MKIGRINKRLFSRTIELAGVRPKPEVGFEVYAYCWPGNTDIGFMGMVSGLDHVQSYAVAADCRSAPEALICHIGI